ncbi:MAG: hypothetical protein QXS54_11460 [Candidatus Methanomethylicaceae archaeon]
MKKIFCKLSQVSPPKAILFLFLLINAILSVMFFALDEDSAVFLTIARGILDGRVPYRDFFDHKPPGVYVALLLPLLLDKASIWVAKAFLLVICAVAIGLLVLAVRVVNGDREIQYWTLISFLPAWIFWQGYTLRTEIFVALSALASLVLAWCRRWSIAGMFLGLAVLFKQTAALYILPLAWYAGLHQRRAVLEVYAWSFGVATLGLVAMSLVAGFDNVFQQVILSNFAYIQNLPLSLRDRIKGLYDFIPALPLWLASCGTVISNRHDRKAQLVAHFLAASLIPIALSPVRYYLLPSVPFTALLAGRMMREIAASVRSSSALFTAFTILSTVALSSTQSTAGAFSNLYLLHQLQAAQTIKNLTLEGEPILMIAAAPQYYFLSGRYPPDKNLYLLAVNHSIDKEIEAIQQIKSGRVKLVGVRNHVFTDMYASRIRTFVEQSCMESFNFSVLELRLYLCPNQKS